MRLPRRAPSPIAVLAVALLVVLAGLLWLGPGRPVAVPAVVVPAAPRAPLPAAVLDPGPAPSPECVALGPPSEDRARLPSALMRSRDRGTLTLEVDVVEGRVVSARRAQASGLGTVTEEAALDWALALGFPSGLSARGCRVVFHVDPD